MKNLILGLLVGLIVGGWAGLNTGKERPMFSNPFVEDPKPVTTLDQLKSSADELIESGRDALHKATQ
ncbi:MAG: hypothetical protein Q9O24_01545 [Gammaproteobacteria bacterium]|nr:hypothetical protein [Gammaproteobacteria bacterium]